MGPGATFRRLARLAERRPRLVAVIGLALVAEGGRVVWSTARGGEVVLFGHAGTTAFDAVADRSLLLVYVAWVTLCGILLVSFAGRARTAARAAAARTALGGRRRDDPAVIRRRAADRGRE